MTGIGYGLTNGKSNLHVGRTPVQTLLGHGHFLKHSLTPVMLTLCTIWLIQQLIVLMKICGLKFLQKQVSSTIIQQPTSQGTMQLLLWVTNHYVIFHKIQAATIDFTGLTIPQNYVIDYIIEYRSKSIDFIELQSNHF